MKTTQSCYAGAVAAGVAVSLAACAAGMKSPTNPVTPRATSANRTVFHSEGGKEHRPIAVRFPLRPGPLAR